MKHFYQTILFFSGIALALVPATRAQTLREVPRIGHGVPEAVIQEALLRQLAAGHDGPVTPNLVPQAKRQLIATTARSVLRDVEAFDGQARTLILEFRGIQDMDEALRQRGRFVEELQRLQRSRDTGIVTGFANFKARLNPLERSEVDRALMRIRSKAFRRPALPNPVTNRPEVRQ